ncbi:hypothetical protein [Dietzia sp. 179-F 9C3 NHS]|uniref:hypothetical protein n=1 Tax=Dietzia sp. 179-F 9C3 NHS TaxID=3374295 RepID=UPI003879F65D
MWPFAREDNGPEVAIGTGRYGDPVLVPCGQLKKAIAIFGTSRSGKTRLATSIADQQSRQLGCGQIVLDFKGDDDLVRRKAELARELGRTFLHFQLAPKARTTYRAPHPYAPPRPAHYDPFTRGNGKSKASMLLNSVPRHGDAAVYLRQANEAVSLAWDLAALKGLDQQRKGSQPPSGLQVLSTVLSADTIVKLGNSLTVDEVVRASGGIINERDAAHRVGAIQQRMASFSDQLGRPNSTLSGSISDTASQIGTILNDSALDGRLTPGAAPAMRIDLVRAILRREIVVFSLPAQDYPDTAALVGTTVLLDLQSTVATLRSKLDLVARYAGAGTGSVDGTPWAPLVLQMEEVGSANTPEAANAMIGLFNKSADMGIRPILSSQSIADVLAIDDGQGVVWKRLRAQMDHLFTLKLSSSDDAKLFAAESSEVRKMYAVEEAQIERNRFRFGQGAGETSKIRKTSEDATRIPADAVVGLRVDPEQDLREVLFINGADEHTAVHTCGPEGPNNWYEKIRMVPVLEKPYQWDPYADDDVDADAARDQLEKVMSAQLAELQNDGVLAQILTGRDEALDVTSSAAIDVPDALRPARKAAPQPAGVPVGAEQDAVPGPADPYGPGMEPPPDYDQEPDSAFEGWADEDYVEDDDPFAQQ